MRHRILLVALCCTNCTDGETEPPPYYPIRGDSVVTGDGGDSFIAGDRLVNGDTHLAGDNVGDAFAGDAFAGDAFAGDAFTGDAFAGDAFTGDAFTGDAFTGDAFTGDAFTGDASAGDACSTGCRPSWRPAVSVSMSTAGDARNPHVAMDGHGNAVAVWGQHDGTRDNIWANRYVANAGWGTAELIETDDAGDASWPRVAMDSSGNAIVVWEQHDGTRYNVWANRYVPGNGWRTATLLETDNIGNARYPDVAMNTGGVAIAIWEQYDGDWDNIWSSRYLPGNGWEDPTLVETEQWEFAYRPHIAMDSSGNAVALWEQTDEITYNIWANHYVAGVGWGATTMIQANTQDASRPHVAMNGSGNAVAVWVQQAPPLYNYNMWANRFVAGEGWGTATLIETEDVDAHIPDVAMSADGSALAVWEYGDIDETLTSIRANSITSGSWGTDSLLEHDDTGSAGVPCVAMDGGGNGVAVWTQYDGEQYSIWADDYVSGTGWRAAALIETDNAGGASMPAVAMDETGNAVAVWRQSDGKRFHIRAASFE